MKVYDIYIYIYICNTLIWCEIICNETDQINEEPSETLLHRY